MERLIERKKKEWIFVDHCTGSRYNLRCEIYDAEEEKNSHVCGKEKKKLIMSNKLYLRVCNDGPERHTPYRFMIYTPKSTEACTHFAILRKTNRHFFSYILHSDMLPLPYATKENYKVLLYRLADLNADKVSYFYYTHNFKHRKVVECQVGYYAWSMDAFCFVWRPRSV